MREYGELLEISKNKEFIIEMLKSTNREGIDKVIDFLCKSNFFTQYGSYRHHRYPGGLAEHSIGVCKKALEANEYQKNKCDKDSIIICGLLHDICKVSLEYTPKEYDYGHGSRSIKIIEQYLGFKLKDDERRAIRFHMAKRNRVFNDEDYKEYVIAEQETLRNIIHSSDNMDSATSFIKSIFW